MLTKEDLADINNCLDLAVKTGGLRVASRALELANKITQMIKEMETNDGATRLGQ